MMSAGTAGVATFGLVGYLGLAAPSAGNDPSPPAVTVNLADVTTSGRLAAESAPSTATATGVSLTTLLPALPVTTSITMAPPPAPTAPTAPVTPVAPPVVEVVTEQSQ